jgi:hypothetical protein
MYIAENVDMQMWQLANLSEPRPVARLRKVRRKYASGLAGFGEALVDASQDVAELLSEFPVYAEAKKKNAELDQRILVLDYNIVALKIADVSDSERSAALKVLNDQRVQAVSDQKKLQKVIADMQIAAAKDVNDMNKEELATYRKQLTDRYSLLKKTRAEAEANVEPAQLDSVLATIDAQLDKVKKQMTAAGATFKGLSGLSSLEKSLLNRIKDEGKRAFTQLRNITKKLPGAEFISDKIAPIVAAPIVRLTGNKKQRKAAAKAMKVIVIAAAVVVAAVVLYPLVMPTLSSLGSGALSLAKGGFGLVKAGTGFLGKFASNLIPKGAGGKLQELFGKAMTKDNLDAIKNALAGKPDKPEDGTAPQDTSAPTDGYPVQYAPENKGMSTNMKIGIAAGGVGVVVLAGLAIFALRK